MLICRACHQPADASTRSYGNELVQFTYQHRHPEGPPTEHTFNVDAHLARELVEEDAARAKEPR